MQEFLNWLIPLTGAFLTPLLTRSRKATELLAMITVGVSALLSISLLFALDPSVSYLQLPGFRLGIRVDQLSVYMAVIASVISFLIVLYSTEYIGNDPSYTRYYFFFQLFVGAMIALVMSSNLLQTYFFWEIVGLCSYALIGFWYKDAYRSAAGLKAFITTRIGDTFFLAGIVLLFATTGTFEYSALAEFAKQPALQSTFLIAGILIFGGVIGKSAQFPLHVWLPDAMAGPTTVSALIHAATMVKAGIFLVARTSEIFSALPEWGLYISYTGAFTALIAASMGIVNNDLKKVLAYSTISQLGLMLAALGLLTEAGWAAGTFHIYSHALFKALLFLSAGAVLHATNILNIKKMGGLRKFMPFTFIVAFIGIMANSGVPPFNGFFTKELIIASTLHSNLPIFIMVFITSIFTVFYSFRWFGLIFLGKPRSESIKNAHDGGLAMKIPLALLAIGVIITGFLLPSLFGFFHLHEHALIDMTGLLITAVILTIGGGTSILMYWTNTIRPDILTSNPIGQKLHLIIMNGYYFDHLYNSIAKGFLSISNKAYIHVEKSIIDGFNYVLALSIRKTGNTLKTDIEKNLFEDGMVTTGDKILKADSHIANFDKEIIDGVVNRIWKDSLKVGKYFGRLQSGIIEQYAMWASIAVFLLIFSVLIFG